MTPEIKARYLIDQKKVSLERFSSLAVPLPSLNEQSYIVQALSDAKQEASTQFIAIELSLKQSTAQRQKILRAAFADELVLQDPNDEPASVLLEHIRTKRAGWAAIKIPRGCKAHTQSCTESP